MDTRTRDIQSEDTEKHPPVTTLFVVGAGPGALELLTGEAREAISRCRYFAGGRRQLELAPSAAETCAIGSDLEEVRRFVAEKLKEGDVCVLASGDPGCYSILPFLKEHFGGRVRVIPGLSSVQVLAARLGEPWQDWRLVSLHGRDAGAVPPPEGTTVYLCDGKRTPQSLARLLLEENTDGRAAVGANLGTQAEEIFEGSLPEVAAGSFPGNSLLLVMPGADGGGTAPSPAPGIPDGQWLRREGIPLSKREVRAVLLACARPRGRKVIWDIGAGTGSYGIECALLEPGARVIAIDRNPEALELVQANAGRFGACVETAGGEAPDCLKDLPQPDLVIIGGSDGRLEDIFAAAARALSPGGGLVVTAVLEETMKLAPRLFAESGLQNCEAVRVAIARGDGRSWTDNNPVVIFSGDANG